MNIVPLRPDHADQLYDIYVAQVALSAHSRFIPNRQRFRDEMLGAITRPASLFDAPKAMQHFVAEEAGVAQGFASLVTFEEWNEKSQGITGLFVANAAAADALILACEANATLPKLDAFPSSHGNTWIHSYNAAWDGLSDTIPFVPQALAAHGYVPYFRELSLIAPLDANLGASGPVSKGITISAPEAPPEPNGEQVVRALDGEERVGVCIFSTLAALTDNPEASKIGYIWWLHVHDDYRRRGIARVIITAVREYLIKEGCTSWWLTTTADNWRAQSLYYTLGFAMVDCSVSFRKQLRE